jgi:hypothetical protein
MHNTLSLHHHSPLHFFSPFFFIFTSPPSSHITTPYSKIQKSVLFSVTSRKTKVRETKVPLQHIRLTKGGVKREPWFPSYSKYFSNNTLVFSIERITSSLLPKLTFNSVISTFTTLLLDKYSNITLPLDISIPPLSTVPVDAMSRGKGTKVPL